MKIAGFFSHDDGVARVILDGVLLSPRASQRIWNHSPTGFNWGYEGSGPAQLALALLLAAGVEPNRAVRLHQEFKRDCIARLPEGPFELELDIAAWADAHDRVTDAKGLTR